MTTGHTPEKWEIAGTEIWAGGRRICSTGGAYGHKDKSVRSANLRLMRAAPELASFYAGVAPLLNRLKQPRYDADETNEYILNSTDYSDAMIAFEHITQALDKGSKAKPATQANRSAQGMDKNNSYWCNLHARCTAARRKDRSIIDSTTMLAIAHRSATQKQIEDALFNCNSIGQ